MPKVIVVGGGYAGLSAATALAEQGVQVELLESHGFLGGRAYSIAPSESFPAPADNGSHLFMGCCAETLRMLGCIGAGDSFHWLDPFHLTWRLPGGKKVSLNCPPLPPPYHLAWGLFTSNAFPWGEKRSMSQALSVFSKKPFTVPAGVETLSQFLDATAQGPASRERFWVPLCKAVVNVPPEEALLAGLGEVLHGLFFGSRRDSALGIVRYPLSEMVSTKARKYLENQGARVLLHEGVREFTVKDGAWTIKTRPGAIYSGDALIFAVPPSSLASLWPAGTWDRAAHFDRMGKSPILSVHLILSKPVLDEHITGFPGSKFEWVFNRNANWNWLGLGVDTSRVSTQPKLAPSLEAQGQVQYLSFIASAAEELSHFKDPELVEMAWKDLTDRCPKARRAEILHSKVTREMAATFRWTKETDAFRPPCETPLPGVFLAGDWTDTGLPATLEGACFSGHRAAEKAREHLSTIPSQP